MTDIRLKEDTRIFNDIFNMLDKDTRLSKNEYKKLVDYVQKERMMMMGWVVADACFHMDRGEDYRKVDIPNIVSRALNDLSNTD